MPPTPQLGVRFVGGVSRRLSIADLLAKASAAPYQQGHAQSVAVRYIYTPPSVKNFATVIVARWAPALSRDVRRAAFGLNAPSLAPTINHTRNVIVRRRYWFACQAASFAEQIPRPSAGGSSHPFLW
jgi:hypothetical protein